MNAFDELGDHTRQLLHMSGREDGIVFNYSPTQGDSAEWYEETVDTEWTEDDGTEITVRVNLGQQNLTQGPAGQELEGDALIIVDPNEADFSDGSGLDDRSSEILDTRDDARYRVEKLIDDHGGVLTLDASLMEQSA